jgi:hypothetical protein
VKPLKIFDISRQFASRNESENEGKCMFSRVKPPKNVKISRKLTLSNESDNERR